MQIAKVLCSDTYSQPGNQVMQLAVPFEESLTAGISGADGIWHCPEHPADDFYGPQAFVQARANHGMTHITTDAQMAALKVGSRVVLHFGCEGWAPGYYATMKIE